MDCIVPVWGTKSVFIHFKNDWPHVPLEVNVLIYFCFFSCVIWCHHNFFFFMLAKNARNVYYHAFHFIAVFYFLCSVPGYATLFFVLIFYILLSTCVNIIVNRMLKIYCFEQFEMNALKIYFCFFLFLFLYINFLENTMYCMII